MGDAATLVRRGRWAAIALAVVIVTDLIAIWSDWLEIQLFDRAINGEEIELSTFDSADIRQGLVALLQLAALVAAVILFLRWFHRSYVALPHLGATRRFGSRWAIGAWFVPFVNVWRPKQIADDLWRGTDPGKAPTGNGSWGWRSSWLITAWWISWLVLAVVETRAIVAWSEAPLAVDAGPPAAVGLTEGAEDARSAAVVDLVSSLVDIPVAVLAILVVRALTSRLVERMQLVATLAASVRPARQGEVGGLGAA